MSERTRDGERMSVTQRAPAPGSRPRHQYARSRRPHPYDAAGRLWAAILLAVAIAAAGAAWGAHAATQASHAQSRIGALQAELAGVQRRVADEERSLAGQARHLRSIAARATGAQRSLQHINWMLQSVPSESQLAALRSVLAAYGACIPQLQREIDGLGLSWRIDAAKPATDYFRLSTGAAISAACTGELAGR